MNNTNITRAKDRLKRGLEEDRGDVDLFVRVEKLRQTIMTSISHLNLTTEDFVAIHGEVQDEMPAGSPSMYLTHRDLNRQLNQLYAEVDRRILEVVEQEVKKLQITVKQSD